MLIVGLSGGIGSGKTAVSAAFARRGVPIIDTDVLARELVEPGQPALAEIVQRFGSQCLTAGGQLDRRSLRQQVFADAGARQALEAILHPRIRAAVQAQLATLDAPYCLVVIPLLAENPGFRTLLDRVLVVDVAPELQRQRVMARDGIDANQAQAMLAAQASRAQRLAIADDVIDNSGNLAALDPQVAALHRQYLHLDH